MKIRKAKIKDIEQIVSYGIDLIKYHHKLDPYFAADKNVKDLYQKFFKKSIYSRNSNLLVAEENGKIIGYALGGLHSRVPIFKIKKVGSINEVFVKKEFRKIGISKQLVIELSKWFRDKKIKYVEISVHVKNEIGKRAWAKCGFEDYMSKQRVEVEKLHIK